MKHLSSDNWVISYKNLKCFIVMVIEQSTQVNSYLKIKMKMKLMAEWLKKQMKICSIIVNKLTQLNVIATRVIGE